MSDINFAMEKSTVSCKIKKKRKTFKKFNEDNLHIRYKKDWIFYKFFNFLFFFLINWSITLLITEYCWEWHIHLSHEVNIVRNTPLQGHSYNYEQMNEYTTNLELLFISKALPIQRMLKIDNFEIQLFCFQKNNNVEWW